MKPLKTLLSFLPALCIMIVIFAFSAQDSVESSDLSSGVTMKILQSVDHIAHFGHSQDELLELAYILEHFVRKTAHFTEYAILAVSLLLPVYRLGFRKFRLGIIVQITGTIYAISDEVHQRFIPGRYGCLKDVIIDSLGVCTAILLFLYFLKSHEKNRKNSP